jgi:Tol biopolymer transport system component
LLGLVAACGSSGGLKWNDENPAWSPDGRKIAFDSNRADPKHGVNAVYVMNADGSGVRRLTHGAGDAELPQWSPRGTLLVYIKNLVEVQNQYGSRETVYGDHASINVVHADGSDDKVLALSDYSTDAEWSPDARWIAFDAGKSTEGGQSLEIVHPNGRSLRRLSKNASPFAWSPDGKQLVFARTRYTGGIGIYVVELASGKITRLAGLADGDDVTDISWSPDGSQIAFVGGWISSGGDALERGRAYELNANGSNLHVVSSAGDFPKYNDFSSGVAWLPRTARALLYNTDNGVYRISVPKGRRRISITEGSPAIPSPGGEAFLFVLYTSSGRNALYVQKLNGSPRQLTQTRRQ